MENRFNTIAGWVLGSGMVALALSSLSYRYFEAGKHHAPEKPGYAVEGAEGEGEAGAKAEVPFETLLASAFDSAGQRCSALRVLCVQEEAADRVVEMLQGAMGELRVGNTAELRVDVGPVIDAEAQTGIVQHIEKFKAQGHRVYQHPSHLAARSAPGTFVPPTLIELDQLGELQREVFGPVLHLVRYPRAKLGELLAQINDSGYGLTLGVHTRIDETIAEIIQRIMMQRGEQYRQRVRAQHADRVASGEGERSELSESS